MRFRRNAQLDTSQVTDLRGRRMGGMPAVGGGLGVIGLLVALFLGVDPFGGGAGYSVAPEVASNLVEECKTGEDANLREDCRIVGIVNSVQAFWSMELLAYEHANTHFFTGAVSTGCGQATSAVGPFYCPS